MNILSKLRHHYSNQIFTVYNMPTPSYNIRILICVMITHTKHKHEVQQKTDHAEYSTFSVSILVLVVSN